MNDQFKRFVKNVVPPILLKQYRCRRGLRFLRKYSSWEEALRHSTGYDSNEILQKVADAALRVKSGEAVYERDSVVFDKVQYSFPVLAALLRAAIACGGKLSVLDFGGSLGTSYHQCRSFMKGLSYIRWSIVEQEHFSARGRELFESDELKFYCSVDECLQREQPEVVLLSSVLQYLKEPYKLLEGLAARDFECIVIDRTPFTEDGGSDILTVQVVPPSIYEGSYPSYIFNEEKLCGVLSDRYQVLASFEALDGRIESSNIVAEYKGLIFTRGGDGGRLASGRCLVGG